MSDGMFAKQFESIEKRAIDGFWDQHATLQAIPGYDWCPEMQWYVEPLSWVQERAAALMTALNAGSRNPHEWRGPTHEGPTGAP